MSICNNLQENKHADRERYFDDDDSMRMREGCVKEMKFLRLRIRETMKLEGERVRERDNFFLLK
jgi:hypothetical protein